MNDAGQLADAMKRASKSKKIAVDTEADSRHHFPEKVCLVQVAAKDSAYLIDSLAPLDFTAFGKLLADQKIEKVFHGSDFDVRGLNRDWGFTVASLYDTNVAARFAGLERFGLAALIEDLLGIVIPKDQRLQRADWSRRPLSDEALEYAAGDVVHLVDVRDSLDTRLKKLKRDKWAAEEFKRLEDIRYSAPDPETAFLSVKGSHVLDGKGLAILKFLHELRETEARRLNRPTAFVISAEALVYLAGHPDASLEEVPGLGHVTAQRIGGRIKRALKDGKDARPFMRPRSEEPIRPRPTSLQMSRLNKLKKWRVGLGGELALDPSLLWPMRSLERLARDPATLDQEYESSDVRRWQRAEYGRELEKLLA